MSPSYSGSRGRRIHDDGDDDYDDDGGDSFTHSVAL